MYEKIRFKVTKHGITLTNWKWNVEGITVKHCVVSFTRSVNNKHWFFFCQFFALESFRKSGFVLTTFITKLWLKLWRVSCISVINTLSEREKYIKKKRIREGTWKRTCQMLVRVLFWHNPALCVCRPIDDGTDARSCSISSFSAFLLRSNGGALSFCKWIYERTRPPTACQYHLSVAELNAIAVLNNTLNLAYFVRYTWQNYEYFQQGKDFSNISLFVLRSFCKEF